MSEVKDHSKFEWISGWLIASGGMVLISLVLVGFFLSYDPAPSSVIGRATSGIVGNVISGVWTGIFFLLLAAHLNTSIERSVTSIEDAIDRQALSLTNKRRYDNFIKFLRDESYHDITIPTLKSEDHPLGLHYTVLPVRENGVPKVVRTEMEEFYILKTKGPAHESVMSPEEMTDYENSSIKDNTFYFCWFQGGTWMMSEETFGLQTFEIYLSGKVGPAAYGQSANVLMGLNSRPSGLEAIAELRIDANGNQLTDFGSCFVWEMLKDNSGDLFLRTKDSSPRAFYYVNSKERPDDWFLYLEGMRGFFDIERLNNFRAVIEDQCKKLHLQVKRVEWWTFS